MTSILLHGCSCAGDGIELSAAALTAEPQTLELGELTVGARRTAEVTLRSVGQRAVTLRAIRADGVALVVGAEGTLAPGGSRTLVVELVADHEGAVAASLTIESDAAPVVVPIRAIVHAVPTCDDGASCTEDHFDAQLERCVSTPREGPCDDGDACTVDDVCQAGACVGAPRSCDDAEACTADQCVDGACQNVVVADGVSCTDDDVCTVGDACLAGRCGGRRTTELPQARGAVHTSGTVWSTSVILGDGRVVMVDPLGGGRAVVSVLAVDSTGAPQLQRRTIVANVGGVLFALGRHDFAVLGGPNPRYRVDEQGDLTLIGEAPYSGHTWFADALDTAVYACGTGGLRVLDASGDNAPSRAFAIEPTCRDLDIDVERRVLVVATERGYLRYDVSEPLAPRRLSETEVAGYVIAVSARGGLIAVRSAARVELHAADGDALLAEVDGRTERGGIFLDGQDQLGVAIDGLAIQMFDVSSPSTPVALAQLSTFGRGPQRFRVSTDMVVGEAAVALTRDELGQWRPWSRTALGEISRVEGVGGRLYSYGADHLRELTVDATGVPSIVAGGLWPEPLQGWLVLGPERVMARGVGQGVDLQGWYDADVVTVAEGTWPVLEPEGERLIQRGELDVPRGGLAVAVGDRHLVVREAGASAELVILALGGPSDARGAPLSVTPYNVTLHDSELPVTAIGSDGRRVAAAFNTADGATLVVHDVSDPRAPRELARRLWERPGSRMVRDVAIRGDRLVYLTDAAARGGTRFTGQTLHVAKLVIAGDGSGSIVDDAQLDMPRSENILRLEADQALVSDEMGLAYLRIATGTVAVAHRVPLPDLLLSTAEHEDALVIGGLTSATVISPPCLPP